jgi:hypothetical protein
MSQKLTKQRKNHLRNELCYVCYLYWRWKIKRAHYLSPKHSLTLSQGFTNEMGENEVKVATIGVFIGEEMVVDKNQLIWLLASVCQV